jgi:hypothetical protein
MKSYLDRALRFVAGACSEEDGSRSSRRLVMVYAIFSGVGLVFGLFFKNPVLAKELMEFIILNAIGVYFGTKMTETIKGPPSPPAAPATA